MKAYGMAAAKATGTKTACGRRRQLVILFSNSGKAHNSPVPEVLYKMQIPPSRARIAFEAGIAVFFFGCIAVAVKFISANAITIGIARLAMTVAILLPVLSASGRLKGLRRQDLRPLAVMGLFFALHWLTFFFSIKIGTASIATVGLSTYGVHLVVLGWLFLKERVTIRDIAVVALAVVGSLLVVPEFNLRNNGAVGLGLSILSGFFYAFLPILQQRHAHIPVLQRAAGQFVFGLVVFLFFLPLSDWHLTFTDWIGLAFLGILCTLVSHTLWVRVTTILPTTTTSALYYLYVPISLILSVVVLDETVNLTMIIGALLIVAANVIGILRKTEL
jgi:drug/metabolite transporter (DMT)-like permease